MNTQPGWTIKALRLFEEYNQQDATFLNLFISVRRSTFISVINQLDAQNFCFTISLFHASTCFEHMCSPSGGQNCITQPLTSSHWNKWVV